MNKRDVDQSQPGGEVHRLDLGCGDPEPRLVQGQKITPEYVARLATDVKKIKDVAARDFCLAVLEILLSRESASEAVERVGS
jgi:hypothetical protein